MTELTEFKRLRFFTGFFTTARDWQAEQNYHREKLKLHNKRLHTPGILRGEGEGLAVMAIGGLKLQVQPGAALDSLGNTISLGAPQELVIDKDALKLPKTDKDATVYDLYVVATYNESPDDYVANVTQPEYSGHTRIVERPCFKVTRELPDNQVHLKLAQIRLRKDADKVTLPLDPHAPGVNEIDCRNLVYSSDARDIDDRLKEEEAKSSNFEERLVAEEAKSGDFERRLIEQEGKTANHEARLGEEEAKSSNVEQRLIAEEAKSADSEQRLVAEEAKSGDFETRLVQEEGKSVSHEARLSAEEAKSANVEQRLIAEEAKSGDFEMRLVQEEGKSQDLAAKLTQLDGHRRLHNRRLHTPGVLRGEGGDLAVKAAGGLNVRVAAGAAQDAEGNTVILEEPSTIVIDPSIYNLPDLVFIAIGHEEGPASGDHPHLRISTHKPTNRTWLELARINLQPGVTEISDPADPDNPGGNQINQNHVLTAGAVGVVEAQMTAETLRHIIQVMGRTRRDFAALDDRFPTLSAGDVRHAALTVETVARIGSLRPAHWPNLLATLAAIEQDVKQEIHKKYANVVDTGKKTGKEFHEYVAALHDLQEALPLGEERDILTAQDRVAAAARELSEIPIESPIADAGRDQTAVTFEDEAAVMLDASKSQARGGRNIVRYRWERGA